MNFARKVGENHRGKRPPPPNKKILIFFSLPLSISLLLQRDTQKKNEKNNPTEKATKSLHQPSSCFCQPPCCRPTTVQQATLTLAPPYNHFPTTTFFSQHPSHKVKSKLEKKKENKDTSKSKPRGASSMPIVLLLSVVFHIDLLTRRKTYQVLISGHHRHSLLQETDSIDELTV